LFADGANRYDISQLNQFANIFQNQNRIVSILENKWGGGYQDEHLNDISILDELHFLTTSNNAASLEGFNHGVSHNTVGASRTSTTAIFPHVVVQAVKGLSPAHPENFRFFGG
jgi:hypothetical protein